MYFKIDLYVTTYVASYAYIAGWFGYFTDSEWFNSLKTDVASYSVAYSSSQTAPPLIMQYLIEVIPTSKQFNELNEIPCMYVAVFRSKF